VAPDFLRLRAGGFGTARLEAIPVKDNKFRVEDGLTVRGGKVECFIEPYSLNALTVRFSR
jgi:hypothetical protein